MLHLHCLLQHYIYSDVMMAPVAGLLIVVGLGIVIGIFIGLVLLAMVMMWMKR